MLDLKDKKSREKTSVSLHPGLESIVRKRMVDFGHGLSDAIEAGLLLYLNEPKPCPHCGKLPTDPPGNVVQIKPSRKGANSTDISVPNEAAPIISRVVALVSRPGGLEDFRALIHYIATDELARAGRTARDLMK